MPFEEFNALLTYKLLSQLEMMEADTIVEANSQNVSCFFWSPSSASQQKGQAGVKQEAQPQINLQEFR